MELQDRYVKTRQYVSLFNIAENVAYALLRMPNGWVIPSNVTKEFNIQYKKDDNWITLGESISQTLNNGTDGNYNTHSRNTNVITKNIRMIGNSAMYGPRNVYCSCDFGTSRREQRDDA